jgi:hypothetical protein
VSAVKAFDPRFVTDTLNPLVVTGYGIATSSLLVLPEIGKNIGATTKQASDVLSFVLEKRNLKGEALASIFAALL